VLLAAPSIHAQALYAVFDTNTGEVSGKTAARHTSAEFVALFTDIVIDQLRGKEIRVIADNLSAHKSRPVTDFLAGAPRSSLALHSDLLFLAEFRSSCGSARSSPMSSRGVVTCDLDLKRKL
jgi:hypothetical protein